MKSTLQMNILTLAAIAFGIEACGGATPAAESPAGGAATEAHAASSSGGAATSNGSDASKGASTGTSGANAKKGPDAGSSVESSCGQNGCGGK